MRNRIRENSYSPTVSKPVLVDTPKWKLTQNTYDLYVKLVERVANELGHEIFMPSTWWYRTVAEQQALYAKWRTAPWNIVTYVDWVNSLSDHQLWIAFDIAFRWPELYPASQKIWDNVWAIAMDLWLLRWRHEWQFDKPHFWLESDRWVEVEERNILDIEATAKEVWDEYWISSDFIICVATAETSLGKNIKSKWNYLNTWNHDSWVTKWFDSLKDNFQYWMDALVNWPYLSNRSNIAELSCWWRLNVLGRDSCQPNWEYFWASSDYNRHNNVTTCLSKRLWWVKEDYDTFNYKM